MCDCMFSGENLHFVRLLVAGEEEDRTKQARQKLFMVCKLGDERG